MGDTKQGLIKDFCCMCLSRDRKLEQLCNLKIDSESLNWLLYDNENQVQFTTYKEEFYVCWECRAIINKIITFRRNANIALGIICSAIIEILDGNDEKKFDHQSLSTLSVFQTEVSYISPFTSRNGDHFIDCGKDVKEEIYSMSGVLKDDYEMNGEHLLIDDQHITYDDMDQDSGSNDSKSIQQNNNTKITVDETIFIKAGEKYSNASEVDPTKRMSRMKKNYASAKCEVCNRTFRNVYVLRMHYKRIHQNVTHSTAKVKKKGIKAITVNQNDSPSSYKCSECDKTFATATRRSRHISRYHRDVYPCSICGKIYHLMEYLRKHEQMHTGTVKRIKCEKCNKMVRYDLYKKHTEIHTNRQSYPCDVCDKRFVSIESYKHHLRYSTSHVAEDVVKKYKCNVCDKGFKSKSELGDHTNYQHLNKTKHKCPVCGKALSTKRGITRHMNRAHNKIKENTTQQVCQQCGKTFKRKITLLEHEFVHTGERPRSCEICGHTFRQKASLYTHKRRVHNIRPDGKLIEIITPA